MKLGFIGLGAMGRPMALNLLNKGYDLGVYARRPEALEPLLSAGARRHSSPSEVAERADVVFTMVTATRDVEEVLFAERGLVHGARRGAMVVDMSTIDPLAAGEFARKLSRAGIDMLDAPVSGGPEGAKRATLSMMVGGSHEVLERARPLLGCLAKTIVHMGESGAGQAAKACHQMLLVVTAQGVAEALHLGQRYGLDGARLREAMMAGFASSRVLDLFGGRMAARQFADGIEVRLYHKDLGIVENLAASLDVEVPSARVAMECLSALVDRGRQREDLSAILTVLEERDRPGNPI